MSIWQKYKSRVSNMDADLPGHQFFPGLQYQACIPLHKGSFISNQEGVGYSMRSHAIIAPVRISYLAGQYCGTQDSQLDQIIIFSPNILSDSFCERASRWNNLLAQFLLGFSMFSFKLSVVFISHDLLSTSEYQIRTVVIVSIVQETLEAFW